MNKVEIEHQDYEIVKSQDSSGLTWDYTICSDISV